MQRSFSIIDDDYNDDSEEDITKHEINTKTITNAERNKSSKDEDNVLLDLGDTDSEENSTSPKRIAPKLAKFSPDHLRNATSSLARPGSRITQDPSRMQTRKVKSPDPKDKLNDFLSDSDPEESDNDNDEKKEPVHIPGEYDHKAYENLEVDDEAKEILQYIIKYTPQHLNLDFKFKPFIPEFLPAVGDIDAFLKVIPPENNLASEPYDLDQLQLGLLVLDEPAANQSDPALLHLQLRAASNVAHTNQANVVVKKIDNVEKNAKIIDKWIKDISDLHKSKSSPFVKYSEPMPDLDDLMQAWPEDVENHLKEHGFPYPDSDTSLPEYIDTVCGVFGIPVLKNKIESLHLLFCLYAAVKNSQLYQANNVATEKEPKEEEANADQLVLE